MGSYVQNNLIAGEQVVYETGLHPIVYLSPAAMIFGGIVLGSAVNSSIGAVVLGFGVLALAGAWIRQWASEFAVTNRRVIVKVGFISRRTIEINMSKVESVEVNQDIFVQLRHHRGDRHRRHQGTVRPDQRSAGLPPRGPVAADVNKKGPGRSGRYCYRENEPHFGHRSASGSPGPNAGGFRN
jgi:hypothetical protein